MATIPGRALHYVFKIGDRAKNAFFFRTILGMKVMWTIIYKFQRCKPGYLHILVTRMYVCVIGEHFNYLKLPITNVAFIWTWLAIHPVITTSSRRLL